MSATDARFSEADLSPGFASTSRARPRHAPSDPAKAGPPEAFWSLWLSHQQALRRRSLRLTKGNTADAEDALSATLLAAAQAFRTASVRHPQAWLFRILHNACADQRRRAARCVQLGADPEPPEAGATFERPPPTTPEEALCADQAESAWRLALRTLPGPLDLPLRLHLDGSSDDEIARRLEISAALVRKRRQLAKDRLRAMLAC